MAWSAVVVDSTSGAKLLPVFPASGRCRTVLNGVGDGQHQFKLRDAATAIPRAMVRDLFRPWARTLVICWDERPLYAGLIMRWQWDRASGVLTVDSRELRALLPKRFAWMVPTYPTSSVNPQPWNWKVTGKSLRGLARAVLSRMLKLTPGDGWDMPVVLPADESGSGAFEFWAYNFQSGEDMLALLEGLDGGPDTYLMPRWSSSGALEWVAQIGSPLLANGSLEMHGSAPGGYVPKDVVTCDGADQLTGSFGLGEGSEQDMKVGLAGPLAGSSIPTMDAKRSFKSADTTSAANSRALAALKADREPVMQYELEALVGDFYGSCNVGGTVRRWLDGDEVLDDGWQSLYVIGVSMSFTSEVVSLEVV